MQPAMAMLRWGRARVAVTQTTKQAIWLAAFAMPLICLLVLLGRVGALPKWTALFFAMLVILALVINVILSALLAWIRSPSYAEVAERIDLAADNHNRFATAFDLAQSQQFVSPFAQAAIIDAMAHLKDDAIVSPFMPVLELSWKKPALILMVGIAAVAGSLFMPMLSSRSPALVGNVDTHSAHLAWPGPIEADIKSPPPHPAISNLLINQQNEKSGKSTGSSTVARSKQAHSNSGAVDSANISTGEAALAGSAGNKVSVQSRLNPKTQSASRSPVGNSSSGSSAGKQSVSGDMGTSSSPSSANQTKGDVESETASDASAASGGTSASTPNSDNGGNTTGQSGSGGTGQWGNGGGQSTSGKSAGKGGGESMESVGGPAMRNGAPSGKIPTKKSRGTMLQIQTERQPDFIKGPELPGSDERTEAEIPPQHVPGAPANQSQTDNPGGEESSIDRYWVPPDARAIAGDYFARFHAQEHN